MPNLDRRTTLKIGAVAGLSLGLGFWKDALASPAVVGAGPYGPLGDPDALGLRLPAGFSSRLLGVTGQEVPGTSFEWIGAPDGAATFATGEGGWIYSANSELGSGTGGVASIAFSAAGAITDAYRILGGTTRNCSGGATPWGTWLSGEEIASGHVWECDPAGVGAGVERPALGTFSHEAAVVDSRTGFVYLTEDDPAGRLYRFKPTVAGDLSAGTLQAAKVRPDNTVRWVTVSADEPARDARTTAFNRTEGAWFSGKFVYFCTTGDNKVWALNARTRALEVIYDAAVLGNNAPLKKPDGITVHAPSRDLFVAEGGDDLQVMWIGRHRKQRTVAPFAQLVGHTGSEVTGLAFTPDGTRLIGSSQRGTDGNGVTFEITGPFRSK
ncbi:MAG TPA: alkaline phosphatase PhoX [Actinomycetes bacterium]|nr:alkaline phosphatase PhoX [Actinomycetes bacterium]